MSNKPPAHQEKQIDLPMLTINGRTTLPIVQGWMGVGVSIARLVWSVAREWGVGTLSAAGLSMTPEYKPLYDATIKVVSDFIKTLDIGMWDIEEDMIIRIIDDFVKIWDDVFNIKIIRAIDDVIKLTDNNGNKEEKMENRKKRIMEKMENWVMEFFDTIKNQIFYNTNLDCIKEEIRKAREISEGNGLIYINIMMATEDYERQVLAACEAGIDGIVSGAGFPFSLPEITKDYPNVAIIPILSSARGVNIILKRWKRDHKRLPDAVVLEDPSRAWGHLWSKSVEDINNPETKLEHSIPETVRLFKEKELNIPIIGAWGAIDRDDVNRILALSASWVQMGTRFLATYESGASQKFKQDVVDAWEDDIYEYISSAMLPARALKKSGIFNAKHCKAKVRKCVRNCLSHCAWKDNPTGGSAAQMCILRALANATEGNPPGADKASLEFVGTSAVRIKTLESVKDIMDGLVRSKK